MARTDIYITNVAALRCGQAGEGNSSGIEVAFTYAKQIIDEITHSGYRI